MRTDDYIDVLATTTQQVREWDSWHRPVTSPAIWTRQWGRGRIFVATPGHHVDILEDPNVNTIIKRGMLWASRRRRPIEAAHSDVDGVLRLIVSENGRHGGG
jgi:type 1 glutamine amidotransferase